MNEHLVEATFHAYLDGELTPSARLAAEAHIESCAACRNRLEALGELFEAIESASDAPLTVDLAPTVVERLRAKQREDKRIRWIGAAELAGGLITIAGILASGVPLPLLATDRLASSLQASGSQLLLSAQAELLAALVEIQMGLDQAGEAFRSWQQPGLPVMPLWWVWLTLAVVLWAIVNRILLGGDPRLSRAGKPKGAKHG